MKRAIRKAFGWLILAVVGLALYSPIAYQHGHAVAFGVFAMAIGVTGAIVLAINLLIE